MAKTTTPTTPTAPTLTLAQAVAVISKLAVHVPAAAVGRVIRKIADEIGLPEARLAGEIIATAAPRTAAGRVRIALEQADRVEQARKRLNP